MIILNNILINKYINTETSIIAKPTIESANPLVIVLCVLVLEHRLNSIVSIDGVHR